MSKTTIHSFIPLEKLGEGAFSSVYKVKRISDGGIYALKKIKINALKEKQKANALNQIRILASLSSQHIVTYKQAFLDEDLKLLCIIMEWANGGDLLQAITTNKKKNSTCQEAQIWKMIYHILKGLALLHNHQVLHRDLKSANIFISNGVYKIGDLNVSKVISDQKLVKTQTGTPYYASPEVWRDELYDHKSDIWSLGCIIYEMCTFRPPFLGESLEDLNRSVQKGRFQPIPSQYSKELQELISKCLSLSPRQRPNAEQLIQPTSVVLTKCHFYDIVNDGQKQVSKRQPLLSTIKMPNDIKALNSQLPHSKYQQQIHKNSSVSQSNQDVKRRKINQAENIAKLKDQTQIRQSLQPLPKKPGNLPLPERIKNHLESISSKTNDKSSNRRPKYRIQTSVLCQRKQIPSYLDRLNQRENSIKNKKIRPLSCNNKNRHVDFENRPFSGISSKVRRVTKPLQVHSSLRKIEPTIIQQNSANIRAELYYPRPFPSHLKKLQNQRCHSAQYRKPISSSYLQVKKRLEARQQHLHSSAIYSQNKWNHQNNSFISKSQANLLGNDKYPPLITKDVYLRQANPLKRIEKVSTENRQYLQQIQNKILGSGNMKTKKCISTSNYGMQCEINRLKNICSRYKPYGNQ